VFEELQKEREMPEPKLNEFETVPVIHADGTTGQTKLRVIGVERLPVGTAPHDFTKAREAAKAKVVPVPQDVTEAREDASAEVLPDKQ
jgi:hypothetical protein